MKRASEEEIKTFLKTKGFDAITFRGHTIAIKTVQKNQPVRRSDETERALEVLRQHGVRQPQAALEALKKRKKIQVDTLRVA